MIGGQSLELCDRESIHTMSDNDPSSLDLSTLKINEYILYIIATIY